MTFRSHVPQPRGKRIYGIVILLLVVGGAYLQFKWMQQARKNSAEAIMQPAFAEKLQQWMLMKKGLAPGDSMAGGSAAEQIPCETCLGTGTFVPDTGVPTMCPICLGVGFHMIRRMDPGDRICPLCAGMGRVQRPDTGEVDTCPRCSGRGLVHSPAAAESAPPAED